MRQAESDGPAEKLALYEGRTLTLGQRRPRLELRDKLRRLENQEAYLATGIKLMLSDPSVSPYLLEVYRDTGDLPLAVSSFIRHELDPEKGRILPAQVRLRLYAPQDAEVRRSMYMSQAQGSLIMKLMQKRIKKYKKPLTDTVDELPDKVRARIAIPGVIAEILRQLEEGRSIDELRRGGFLDIGHWKIEMG
ncbi:hypothetical protein [Bradyrhizobium sp. SZCCHNRI20481]|uniref:hypothetical protein n=1 Tax=Bradyrhizobium sp. SZCCHNRI20481 TaxID=3057286 RepID=UPI002915FA7A|nr:hypothetical protein [Bradyrhizobium sp. SZCCHNRI20481]